jgi:L-ribulokinase
MSSEAAAGITVAGVDFGTLSVRVSLFNSKRGRLGSGTAEYPLHRTKSDPDQATQSHEDHMDGLVAATRSALAAAGISGTEVASIALDTTGSSVIPVGAGMAPLDDYYLWCDHRAWREAGEITRKAHEYGLPAIEWCGGVYSSEWGFSKLLHWLRHNPEKRGQFVSAFEHCDFVAAVLCGITDVSSAPRSICAMGHKWMWNASLGGLPPEEFLIAVDPLLAGVREKLSGRYLASDRIAGRLSPYWAERLGLSPGIPIPVGAFDAHWDAIGAGVRLGDVVNVIGTSTCIIGLSETAQLVPGVCGVVPGSVDPKLTGIEAGLSAVGDIFDAIARRSGKKAAELALGIALHRAGETGLLRLTWDNGDRTVLVNPELGGVTLGWNLTHTAEDELFAAMEGTAFHTRIILERMEEHGATVNRIINGGGIPQRNEKLNQVYADVLNKPILVPQGDVTSLGSAIFAFLAAGAFPSIEVAQQALCPPHRVYEPEPESSRVYEEIFPLYRKLYFALGDKASAPASLGDVLPKLREIATGARATARKAAGEAQPS